MQSYLSHLGLSTAADKGFVMCVTGKKSRASSDIEVGGALLPLQTELRFLGVKLDSAGCFLPWRDSFD